MVRPASSHCPATSSASSLTSRKADSRPIYITGDTVWFDGVAEVARRFKAGVVLPFAGAAQTRGPFHLTMDTNDTIETARTFPDAVIVPLHTDGWAHFRQSGGAPERSFDTLGFGPRLKMLVPGVATTIERTAGDPSCLTPLSGARCNVAGNRNPRESLVRWPGASMDQHSTTKHNHHTRRMSRCTRRKASVASRSARGTSSSRSAPASSPAPPTTIPPGSAPTARPGRNSATVSAGPCC